MITTMASPAWARARECFVLLLGGGDSLAQRTAREQLDRDREAVTRGSRGDVEERWYLFLLGHLDEHPEQAADLEGIVAELHELLTGS